MTKLKSREGIALLFFCAGIPEAHPIFNEVKVVKTSLPPIFDEVKVVKTSLPPIFDEVKVVKTSLHPIFNEVKGTKPAELHYIA